MDRVMMDRVVQWVNLIRVVMVRMNRVVMGENDYVC